jgi:RNA polymerase sigma factor (sigma-70 family)
MNDGDLIRAYAKSGSESAFNELVKRHAPMVYSVARRVLGHSPLVEEVTQVVFILLARKAWTLSEKTVLVGWLHRTAYLTALKMLRDERRRQKREQESVAMIANSPEPNTDWHALSQKLDEAIASLADKDRLPILLRFFDRHSMRQVGEVLGISEDAAKMRVGRAMDRLRDSLKTRGISCTSVALGAWLADNSVQAAPPYILSATQAAASNATAVAGSWPALLTHELLLLMTKTKMGFLGFSLIGLLLLSVTGLSVYNYFQKPLESPLTTGDNTALAKPKTNGIARQKTKRSARLQGLDAQIAANEAQILKRMREVLYSPEKVGVLPPLEVFELVDKLGVNRRKGFELLIEALRSNDFQAQTRAASCMQRYYKDFRPEILSALMATLETSHNSSVWHSAAIALLADGDGSSHIATMLKIMETKPETRIDVRWWFDNLLRQTPSIEPQLAQQLSPLLDNPDADIRFHAACALAQLPSARDPRLVDSLLLPIKLPAGPVILYGDDARLASSALLALKNLGPQAKAEAPWIRQFDSRLQPEQFHSSVIDTLAAIAPELASEMPEVAAKLKKLASSSALDGQIAQNQASVTDLMSALQNPEGRSKAAAALGDLGPAAAAALPALRAVLSAESKDDRPDAANYLFDLAQAIRKIDPNAPIYYHHADMTAPLMDVLQQISSPASEPQKSLKTELEKRLFGSNLPFETKEIVDLIGKCQKADPKLGEALVASLRDYSRSRGGVDQADPVFAEAIAAPADATAQ